MLSRNLNGYPAADVENTLLGESGTVEFRTRVELVDAGLNRLYDIENIELDGSSVEQNADDLIQRTARLVITEARRSFGADGTDDFSALILASNPLLYLKENESSGTTAADSTGNGRVGTYVNTPTFGEPGLLAGLTDTSTSYASASLEHVTIAHSAAFNSASFTVARWIKTTAATGAIIDRDNGTNRYARVDLVGGAVRATLSFTAAAGVTFTSSGAINDGDSHFVVVTYDGAYVKIYVDSILILKTAENRILNSITLGWNLSRSQAGSGSLYLNGTSAHTSIWDRALTADEIRDFYQSGSNQLNEIFYERDLIKPYMAVRMPYAGDDGSYWAEVPLGVFRLTSPRRVTNDVGEVIAEVDCYDQSIVLRDDKVTDTYTIAAEVNYISGSNGIIALAQSSGFDTTNWSVTATSLTVPSPGREWPLGTSKLQIINDMLDAINYRPFRFNAYGYGVLEEDVLPSARSPEYTFETSDHSIILPGLDSTLKIDTVPNVVVLSVAEQGRTTLTSTATNAKWSSITSTARRRNGTGPIRVVFADTVDAANQTTLDSLANRKLTELSQVHQEVNLPLTPWPFFDSSDCIRLIDTDQTISNTFIVHGFFLPLLPSEMSVACQAAVSVI